MKYKVVRPYAISGQSISWNLNIFTGPTLRVTCGECITPFTEVMPLEDYPIIVCPYCHTRNQMPFYYGYDR